MAGQQQQPSNATMADLMNAVTDIQARIIRMESTQTHQSRALSEMDERVEKIEKVERGFPWKVLGIVGGAVALLLIPTISTLITVGRRDEALEQTVQTLREMRDEVRQIGARVEELGLAGVSREERLRAQEQRLDQLEDRADHSASPPPRRR